MQSAQSRMNISELIDRSPFSGFQVGIIILCGLIATLDGFDLQVISFVAPAISKQWHLTSAAMGPVFSSGLFGLMLGALISGPIADRFGRRVVVLYSALAFGLFSLLTVSATNVHELLIYRLLTGLGLGGSMPNIIAITSEYSPKRVNRTMVSVMFCGVPVGAVVGSLIASQLVPAHGWHSMFYIGGIIPIVLGIVFFIGCPESIRFLALKDPSSKKVLSILKRITGTKEFAPNVTFYMPEKKKSGMPVKHLFQNGLAGNTILLWVVFFMNLFITYFVSNWLPTVLIKAGLPPAEAIIGIALLEGGGVIGGVVIGGWGDKRGMKGILTWSFFLNAIACIVMGMMSNVGSLMTMIFIAGLLFVGAQFGINALAASIYPTTARSTGVGWALGIGRIGSIIGPTLGGLILPHLASPKQMFMIAAIPSVLAAIAILCMNLRQVEKNAEASVDASPDASPTTM